MEPEKLELNVDTIQALARECYYQSLDAETLNFVMTEFGKELMKSQFFITPIEVENMFKISTDHQKRLRSRINDPLRYHKQADPKKSKNYKILYKTEVTLKWLERNFPEVVV